MNKTVLKKKSKWLKIVKVTELLVYQCYSHFNNLFKICFMMNHQQNNICAPPQQCTSDVSIPAQNLINP